MTEHAILDLHTNVIQSIEKQEKSSCIFLDFAKAFDTVDLIMLLKARLPWSKRNSTQVVWMLSYRNQVVKIGLITPAFKLLSVVYPKEVCFGLYYSLFISIKFIFSKVKFYLFADDTCIFHSSGNLHTLENEHNYAIENISDWLISNKLTLN